jgi:hypothetical protein
MHLYGQSDRRTVAGVPAEPAHLSQPSVSVAIRKLEDHCGFTLFHPECPRVELHADELRQFTLNSSAIRPV